MTTHREDPVASGQSESSKKQALDEALHGRPDGAALRTVAKFVPATTAVVSVEQRDAAWAKLTNRLHDPRRVPYTDDEPRPPIELVRGDEAARRPLQTTIKPKSSLRRWVAIAAALVLAVGTGAVWANGANEVTVPSGAAPLSRQLADGSTAWIAPGTTLRVPRRLGWPMGLATATRTMRLDGEAYFEVRRDGRPFMVHTDGLEVQVLGTAFSVRGLQGSTSGRVAVREGRVAVRAGEHREVLAAGEGVAARDGLLERVIVTSSRVATWRTGGLSALDEPLGEVLSEIARRYAVEVEYDRDVNVQSTVSLFYPSAPTVEVVLSDLCTAQGLAFEKTSRGYRIVQP